MDDSMSETRRSGDDRTRRQVERYRETASQHNGAASVLGRLQQLPTYPSSKAPAAPVRGTTDRIGHVRSVLAQVEFLDTVFTVREIGTDGFLIHAFGKEFFVSWFATDDEIVEAALVACHHFVHASFRFRGERLLARSPDVPVTIPARTPKSSHLRLAVAKGESEKVVKIIQTYFGISREGARRIVRGQEKFVVLPFHVFDLNEKLGKRRLESAAHLATCTKAK